ncbi:MAG: polysaccharide deacetylase family protein [bacterium]|nr:polysaccharide deacetylase family protein [bacterium]
MPIYLILIIPFLYAVGWIYWYFRHGKPSSELPKALSFHKITDLPELGGTFNTTYQFESYMKFLKRNGYATGKISELLKDRSGKKVLIFFDDAYENVYLKAFPIMKKFGFTGVLCPIVDYIGRENQWDRGINRFKHMTREMLIEMKEEGFEIISHSSSHRDLRKLTDGELETETAGSKKKLEEILLTEIDYFIYPFGLYDKRVKRAVKNAGYKGAFASYNEKNNRIDRFAIGRNTMYIIDTLFDLKIIIERKPLFLFGHEDQKGRIINWFSRFSGVIKI